MSALSAQVFQSASLFARRTRRAVASSETHEKGDKAGPPEPRRAQEHLESEPRSSRIGNGQRVCVLAVSSGSAVTAAVFAVRVLCLSDYIHSHVVGKKATLESETTATAAIQQRGRCLSHEEKHT